MFVDLHYKYTYVTQMRFPYQNTASEAVLVCMLAARKRTIKNLAKDPADAYQIMSKMVIYASDQVDKTR